MDKSPREKKIERIITPTAESMGYEIVRIMLIGAGKPTLQVMAEKPDGSMPVDDCGRLSQAISAVLDVENVMEGAYFLEVSSPGIDRPLTRLKDFEKYAGYEAKIEIDPAQNGRKRFKGRLKGVQGDDVVVIDDEQHGPAALPFDIIQKAKLLLTDELLKAAQQKKVS
jgi:ribosome maturation factor RimP